MLASLAMRTTTLRLGSGVLALPWHNPVLLAEQAATVDLMSGGRLDLGIGRGYRHVEFAGFGIAPEEAQQRFDEAAEVRRAAGRAPAGSRTPAPTGVVTTSWSNPNPLSHRTRRCGWRREATRQPRGRRWPDTT